MEIERDTILLLKQLQAAGVVFISPDEDEDLALESAAKRFDCSAKFLREHLKDFPNAWRLGQEIRIPIRDLRAYRRARRIFSKP